MRILIEKSARRLRLLNDNNEAMLSYPIALGRCPLGPKEREGDGRTPEGQDFVCLKTIGKYNKDLQRSQQIYDVIVRAESLPRTATGKIKRYELQEQITG